MANGITSENMPVFSLRELNETEKKARAEVLAACIGKVDKFIAGCQRVAWDKRPLTAGEIKEYWEGVRKQFQELQPAAKGLRELLRQAELSGRLAEIDHFCSHQETLMTGPPFTKAANIRLRVAELKKGKG